MKGLNSLSRKSEGLAPSALDITIGENRMKAKRVYIDTSVIYGAPSKELSYDTRRFWEMVRRNNITIIVSGVLDGEIDRAPAYVRSLFGTIPETQIERIVLTTEANRLAAQYISEGVVGEKSLDDCRHIAIATIAQADAVVSWNLKHMIERREGYNAVNKKRGYSEIIIQKPNEFMEDYNDKT